MSYDALFEHFDSPLMQRVRQMAYGEDIGQHSWVTADELRGDCSRLALGAGSQLLDLGCGACGPLAFLAKQSGCDGTGVDASVPALASGERRAAAGGVKLRLVQHDLDVALPFDSASFDAVISVDVVLHLRDRAALFQEVSRVLRPGGRFVFTDAGVVTGVISSEEVRRRSANATNHFVPPGLNESQLDSAGLRRIEQEDRTPSVVRVARGRCAAIDAYRTELRSALGDDAVARDESYLVTVQALAERKALSRIMYLAERPER